MTRGSKGARAVTALALVLAAPGKGSAETYFVDRDSRGGACSDEHDGTDTARPWCTIGHANATVQAGDTVLLRGGRYGEPISPESSGTETGRITYEAFGGEKVIFSGIDLPISIQDRSHITVRGVQTWDTNRFALIENSHHVWIQDCTFWHATEVESGSPVGIAIQGGSHHNWIYHNAIGQIGYATVDEAFGGAVSVGNPQDPSDQSHSNLIEHNEISNGGRFVLEVASGSNVIRCNYFQNTEWMYCDRPGYESRCGNLDIVAYGGTNATLNVFESNVVAFTGVPPDDAIPAGLSLRAQNGIVRRNVFLFCGGPGLELPSYDDPSMQAGNDHVYHNVFAQNGSLSTSGWPVSTGAQILLAQHGGPPMTGVAIMNNIFFLTYYDTIVFESVNEAAQSVASNWDDMYQGDPLFVDADRGLGPWDWTNGEPLDFRLLPESPCIDQGGFLTRTVGAGEGTELAVLDAGYFTDGFGVVRGDEIQLDGETERATVLAVDYDENVLTVDRPLSWADRQGVSLPYVGSAPDPGAYEHGLVSGTDGDADTDADADGDRPDDDGGDSDHDASDDGSAGDGGCGCRAAGNAGARGTAAARWVASVF